MHTHGRTVALLALVTSVGSTARAQDEMSLRQAFEGKMVTVKLDMPATSKGIDLYPRDGSPVNVRELADRMKEAGVALRSGQSVMVTKVVVKGNSHIEFQLGGGGFGTFSDAMSSPSSVSASEAGESREERELKRQIKEWTGGPTGRKDLERQLRNMQQSRERENDRAQAEATQANVQREQLLMSKRAQAGSRFNVRFRDGILPYYKTPAGLAEALAAYIDFGGAVAATPNASASPGNGGAHAPAAATAAPAAAPAASSGNGLTALKKGLTLDDVEKILGPATTAAERKEGAVEILERGYKKDGMKVLTKFVNGVLIDFTMSPQ